MITNTDLIFYIIGSLLTVIMSLVVYAFMTLRNSVDEKLSDLHVVIKQLNSGIEENGENIHCLETRFLENQIAAGATYITKDDFRECWHKRRLSEDSTN